MAEILYVADFVDVVWNPRGYEVVKLTQREMNRLEEMEASVGKLG